MPMALTIDGLGKRVAGRPLLEGIELALPAGRSLALLGSNGAGKTTLIKCLLDFNRADTGETRIFGESAFCASSRRHLCYLPERFNPPHYLNGREFLKSMLSLYGVAYRHEAVLRQLSALDLEHDCLTRPVRAFSKGMAQKLGLIACLLSERPLIILDEPMSGLDPLARRRFVECMEAQRANGRTLFFTTHMLRDAESLCDYLGFLVNGRLAFFGTADECRQQFGCESLEQAYLDCVAQPSLESVA